MLSTQERPSVTVADRSRPPIDYLQSLFGPAQRFSRRFRSTIVEILSDPPQPTLSPPIESDLEKLLGPAILSPEEANAQPPIFLNGVVSPPASLPEEFFIIGKVLAKKVAQAGIFAGGFAFGMALTAGDLWKGRREKQSIRRNRLALA